MPRTKKYDRTGRYGTEMLMTKKRLTVGLLALCAVVAVEAQDDIWRSDSLQEVVVTGTGTRHLLKNAPVQTEVITNKMLSQYGGKSLEDILAGLTASFAFNEGDMGSQMQLNGLGNNYILILIDGKRIHGDVGGENDLGLIDAVSLSTTALVTEPTTTCVSITRWPLLSASSPRRPTSSCSATTVGRTPKKNMPRRWCLPTVGT